MCRQIQLKPVYISVNVNETNVQCLETLWTVTRGAVNDLK